MHLGLEGVIPYFLYATGICALLLSVFWRPMVGIYYLLPLIPLQTIRYRTNDLPLGSSLVGLILCGVALGLWRNGQPVLPKGPWTRVLVIYAGFTYISLWFGSAYLGAPWPFFGDARYGEWQEYMVMPALLLLTAAASPTKKQAQWMIAVMFLGILLLDKSFWNAVADRDFSTYSEELRQDGGSMGYAGTNGLAAFTAQVTVFLLSLASFESRFWVRVTYYALAIYSVVCLMYSLSRGGYVALFAGVTFLGLVKSRKLILLLVIFAFTWTTLVPNAVQQRVLMTYDKSSGELDNSAETRISLWTNALEIFNENPMFGAGFNTYAYMHLNKRTDGYSGYYADTHNFFLKVLVETGVIGALLFLWLLSRCLFDGFILFLRAHDPFYASLGLGLLSWLICSIVANCFGDRWTYLQVNGYLWVTAGLVCHALQVEQTQSSAEAAAVHSVASERIQRWRKPGELTPAWVHSESPREGQR